jgi:hypothetical protein
MAIIPWKIFAKYGSKPYEMQKDIIKLFIYLGLHTKNQIGTEIW